MLNFQMRKSHFYVTLKTYKLFMKHLWLEIPLILKNVQFRMTLGSIYNKGAQSFSQLGQLSE